VGLAKDFVANKVQEKIQNEIVELSHRLSQAEG
jgi:hypothetical protein